MTTTTICVPCIFFPMLGFPKIDNLRYMTASWHFWGSSFFITYLLSVSSLAFSWWRLTVMKLLRISGRLTKKLVDLWIIKTKSDYSIYSRDKITWMFYISCTINWCADTTISTIARFCILVNPRKFNCAYSWSAFLVQASKLVMISGWLSRDPAPPTMEKSLISTSHSQKGCYPVSNSFWQITVASKWTINEVY